MKSSNNTPACSRQCAIPDAEPTSPPLFFSTASRALPVEYSATPERTWREYPAQPVRRVSPSRRKAVWRQCLRRRRSKISAVIPTLRSKAHYSRDEAEGDLT